jgi:hypothetical protein
VVSRKSDLKTTVEQKGKDIKALEDEMKGVTSVSGGSTPPVTPPSGSAPATP